MKIDFQLDHEINHTVLFEERIKINVRVRMFSYETLGYVFHRSWKNLYEKLQLSLSDMNIKYMVECFIKC